MIFGVLGFWGYNIEWSAIKNIQAAGEEEVFDLTVPSTLHGYRRVLFSITPVRLSKMPTLLFSFIATVFITPKQSDQE
jgi:hypothetical protein